MIPPSRCQPWPPDHPGLAGDRCGYAAKATPPRGARPAQTESGRRTPFNGAWVGIVGGYDHGTIKVTEPGGGDTLSSNRGFYGAAIGVDYKPKQIVYGFETEVSGGGFSRKGDGDDVGEHLRFGRDLYFGDRIGIPVAQNAMVYFKGGYSNLRVVGTYEGDAGTRMRNAMNLDGYRIGAGAQIEHGPILARLEYRFSDYRHDRDVTIHRDQVAAVVGYRF